MFVELKSLRSIQITINLYIFQLFASFLEYYAYYHRRYFNFYFTFSLFVNATETIDFPKALAYNIPWVLVDLILLYFTLLMTHFGLFRSKSETGVALSSFTKSSNEIASGVKQKFEAMGSISIHEIQVGIITLLMIFLLTFQSPGIIPGWADNLNKAG